MTVETIASPRSLVRIVDRTGRAFAVISPRAASLRMLTVYGLDLVEPAVAAGGHPGMAGATLAPWPNRVEDATWWHNGNELRLNLTEPELGNANHGLVTHDDFEVTDSADHAATLRTRIRHPQGYPFSLDLSVTYTMAESGVTVTTTVENRGSERAPVALGAHPYLRVGATPADRLLVTVEATHAYQLDERHIPRDRFAVNGTQWDLREPTNIAAAPAHGTFELAPATGTIVHSLQTEDGQGVELWADPAYRWTQLYIDSDFPSDDGPRKAVAIEPMTAPPNALRSGEGLTWLEPGERWQVSWGIRLRSR
ncbi:aldose epimerase [Leifsonia sp. NPDC058230]|uniref:aldose epimerase family protein n=1 Tax=Leifsonia sp. NPDC058230 TaxID=3346391 RepID=UPI0036DA71BB